MEWLQTHCLKTKRIFVGIGNKLITIWRQKMVLFPLCGKAFDMYKGRGFLPLEDQIEDPRYTATSIFMLKIKIHQA